MLCYVYYKESKIISCKIDNVEYINDSDKEIRSEFNSVKYGDGQDYICLETDSINLNIGDIINLTNLIDERNYFLNKEQWYQEQIKNNKSTIENQKNTINKINEDMNTALLGIADVYEQILNTTPTNGGGTP